MTENTLPPAEIKVIYDEVGRWQDTQGFYEQPAKADLVTHADFGAATSVLEVGGGTGRFAEQLLTEQLPADATYHSLELSTTMVALARQRLERFGARATVAPTDGTPPFDVEAGSVDRMVANYVFDLLAAEATRALLAEARRVMRPGGRLCIASLTRGRSLLGRLVSRGWRQLFRWSPSSVGGCRPVELAGVLRDEEWTLHHQNVVRAWGVPSEVLVAAPM